VLDCPDGSSTLLRSGMSPHPNDVPRLTYPRDCSKLSRGETIPGLSTVPNNGQSGTDADWKKWITAANPNGFVAVSHPIATAAMMKRSLGGPFLYLICTLIPCLMDPIIKVWLMHSCWCTIRQTFVSWMRRSSRCKSAHTCRVPSTAWQRKLQI
jgi:hypothetical protein